MYCGFNSWVATVVRRLETTSTSIARGKWKPCTIKNHQMHSRKHNVYAKKWRLVRLSLWSFMIITNTYITYIYMQLYAWMYIHTYIKYYDILWPLSLLLLVLLLLLFFWCKTNYRNLSRTPLAPGVRLHQPLSKCFSLSFRLSSKNLDKDIRDYHDNMG